MSTPNPPAFPTIRHELVPGCTWTEDGMSLRDYFAAQVLAALAPPPRIGNISLTWGEAQIIAASAYTIADALLEVREKSK